MSKPHKPQPRSQSGPERPLPHQAKHPASLLERALAPGHLREAWKRVRANRGLPGHDGITIAHFERELAGNLAALAGDVRSGAYQPGPLRHLPMRSLGKTRWLAIPTLRDRVLQRAVLDVVSPLCEPRFAPNSFGYRAGLGVAQAVAHIDVQRQQGNVWVLDADIAACFDSFDHGLLRRFVREFVPDPQICALLDQWIALPGRGRGVPLGSVVSPLLCNIYLHRFDIALRDRRFQAARYADDFVVLCPTPLQAARALEVTDGILRKLALRLSQRKTRVVHFDAGFIFLGVHFQGSRQTSLSAHAVTHPGELTTDTLRSDDSL